MSKTRYAFRRESDDVLVYVDFEAMMGMDAARTISDGKGGRMKRCCYCDMRTGEPAESKKDDVGKSARPLPRPIVSDALGFPTSALEQFEQDRAAGGFSGVEFRPDPHVPEFTQVHFSDRGAWRRYMKHRGFVDKNGSMRSKVLLSEDDLRRARELVSR